ncbi:MAG: sulfatase-like hydrolase/transferase, partial [Dehalococcoidales bacterium]
GGAIFFGGMWDHWNVPVNNYDPTGKYNNIINFTDNFFLNNSPVKIHCDSFSTGKHSTELISDASINFLNGYDEDSPFLMYVSFLAPHDPRTMPQRFKDMYNPDEITLPENFAREHSFDYGVKGIRDEMLAPYPRTPECIKTHIAEYYGMISHLDYEIGRIIKTLEDTGKAENTIIVLAGDNGLALGQHGLMGKQNLYEHSVRVPLIFSGAGIPKGVVTDQYIYLMDIFPTLCDCAGIEIPISVEGKSFYPILMGGREEKRETLYFAYSDLIRGVKDRNHKLIYYNGGADAKPALFDILNDPFETENLFDSPEHEQIVKRLNTALMKYKSEWEDTNHPSSKAFYDSFGEHATANRNGHIEGGTT